MKYFILIISIIVLSCAQFVPPTGGPRDIKPPELLSAVPSNKTINFSSKTILLEFDEYLDISSLRQELIVVPALPFYYDIKQKEKTVKLILSKNLDSNTTYTFNFRNGIKDLNERNPVKNLKYVLSTGSKIDSLQIEGIVYNIKTKKPILDALVGLYAPNDTLSPLKRKPTYFTKTDSSGKYLFENIKNNKYQFLAFTDKNQNLIFDQKSEMFGYLKDTINLSKNIKNDSLELYEANHSRNKIKRVTSRTKTFTIQLDKDLKSVNITVPDSNKADLDYTYDRTTLTFFKINEQLKDTIPTVLFLTDSLNVVDTVQQKIYFDQPLKNPKKLDSKPFSIKQTLNKNNQSVSNELEYLFDFDIPIVKFDTSKIIFKTDSVQKETPILVWKNTTSLKININTKAKNQTSLIFPSNIFTNLNGDTNAVLTINNKILQKNELGYLSGRTINKEGNKIAQLINVSDSKIKAEQVFIDKFEFKDIVPGVYNIMIIFDSNKNGIWDPGNFETLVQPEKIIIGKDEIKIKENFEIRDIIIK